MGRLSTVPHDSLNTSKEAYMVCIPPRCCFRGNGPNRTALNRIRAKWVIVAGASGESCTQRQAERLQCDDNVTFHLPPVLPSPFRINGPRTTENAHV